jgi:hypothetical protein
MAIKYLSPLPSRLGSDSYPGIILINAHQTTRAVDVYRIVLWRRGELCMHGSIIEYPVCRARSRFVHVKHTHKTMNIASPIKTGTEEEIQYRS